MSICLELLVQSSNFLRISLVVVARSSSGGLAIMYVLPVLWMMSRLAVMGPMAYFNTRAEFDVYERLVRIAPKPCFHKVGYPIKIFVVML